MSTYSLRREQRLGARKRAIVYLAAGIAASSIVVAAVLAYGHMHTNAPSVASGAATGASANLYDAKLYVDPSSKAAVQAAAWHASKPADAVQMSQLAALPTAKWLTSDDSLKSLSVYLDAAAKAKAVPVLVAYNLPYRDCGNYSAGGVASGDTYRNWVGQLAASIGNRQVVVVLEPDALAGIDAVNGAGKPCLTNEQRTQRYELLSDAVTRLKQNAETMVYVDGGNSGWVKDTAKMADRLRRAGAMDADGFSLNVSNFQTTEASTTYGTAIAKQLHGKHFIIDTSRNGLGPYNNPVHPEMNWCNPPARALGHAPTTKTGNALVDAYLYIKYPGESDGADPDPTKCFGGPAPGVWWPDYALGLIHRWPQPLQRGEN